MKDKQKRKPKVWFNASIQTTDELDMNLIYLPLSTLSYAVTANILNQTLFDTSSKLQTTNSQNLQVFIESLYFIHVKVETVKSTASKKKRKNFLKWGLIVLWIELLKTMIKQHINDLEHGVSNKQGRLVNLWDQDLYSCHGKPDVPDKETTTHMFTEEITV